VLPKSQFGEVLQSIPRNCILPVGGYGCSSLALIASYCAMLKKTLSSQQAGKVIQNEFLSSLPTMLDDRAMRCVLLKTWSSQYNLKLSSLTSRIIGNAEMGDTSEHRRNRFLDNIAPIAQDLCKDLWRIYRISSMINNTSGLYEHSYLGSYNHIVETDKETFAHFNTRINLILNEYQSLILKRAKSRREHGETSNNFIDEVILPKGAIDEVIVDNSSMNSKYQFHVPFNTNEVRFAVGLATGASGYSHTLQR